MPESYQITDPSELKCQPDTQCPCLSLTDGETKLCPKCEDTVTKILNPEPKEKPKDKI
jgi:hypothetical protein